MDDIARLARRLAAHPRWEWREGMLVVRNAVTYRVDYVDQHGPFMSDSFAIPDGGFPDLADPATEGVLLAMIHEEVPHAQVWHTTKSCGWCVTTAHSRPWADFHSHEVLGIAVAEALLAVWGEG